VHVETAGAQAVTPKAALVAVTSVLSARVLAFIDFFMICG
jgi:hypothetical protein